MNNNNDSIIHNYQEIAHKHLVEYESYFPNIPSTNYSIDDVNRETVKAVCKYFANDPEFEKIKEGYKLDKGLLIIGTAGTGKTHLMRNFQNNPRGRYSVIKCSDIASQFSISGRESLLKHTRCYDPNRYCLIGKCFDDLGVEDIGFHFSDKCDTMLNTILDLYDYARGHYYLIHITSNLLPKQIEERYGPRIASRIKEMFNVITLLGDDRRK